MRSVFARLVDLRENGGDELEDVEGLSLERVREGLVVRRLALIEEGFGAGSPVDAGQGDGASHEVTSKPFDAGGVDRPDGGRRIHGEAAVAERSEKLDVFVGEKSFALEFAAALILPNFEKLALWCRESSVPAGSRGEMAAHPRVLALIMAQVENVNREFAQYERVKKIALLSEEFTIERGELTPTLKARGSVIESRYKHLIDELYHEPVKEEPKPA